MNHNYLKAAVFFLLVYACHSPAKEQSSAEKGSRIVIEVEYPIDFDRNLIFLQAAPFNYVRIPSWETKRPVAKKNFAKWTLFSDTPLVVFLKYKIPGKGNQLDLFEPGDSIRIDLKSGRPIYSGNGAEKFKMLQEMDAKEILLTAPKIKVMDTINSIQYYLDWNNYLNTKQELCRIVYESYKDRITPLAFSYLTANKIAEIESVRMENFNLFRKEQLKQGKAAASLNNIFDSTILNEHTKWLQSYTGRIISYHPYFYDYVRKLVERQYNFDAENDDLNSVRRKKIYADMAKRTYKGYLLQNCLVYLLTSRGLKEHSLKEKTPEIDTLLANYYAEPGYPEYKQHVREYERKIEGWAQQKDKKSK